MKTIKVNNILGYIKVTLFIGLLLTLQFSCVEKEDFETFELEGFILGFDPCTINHNYRIGYVIISDDFSDTITTYNLSPEEYKMPAPVGLNPNRPLYTIPELEFRNFRGSAYFPEFLFYPDSLVKNYPIKLTYRKAQEHEKPILWCTTDFYMGDFINPWMNNQVIVIHAFRI